MFKRKLRWFILLIIIVLFFLVLSTNTFAIDLLDGLPSGCDACLISDWVENQNIIEDKKIEGDLTFQMIIPTKNLNTFLDSTKDWGLKISSREGKLLVKNQISELKINDLSLPFDLSFQENGGYYLLNLSKSFDHVNKNFLVHRLDIKISYELEPFLAEYEKGIYSFVTKSLCFKYNQSMKKVIKISSEKYRVSSFSDEFDYCFANNETECFLLDVEGEGKIQGRIGYENIHTQWWEKFKFGLLVSLVAGLILLISEIFLRKTRWRDWIKNIAHSLTKNKFLNNDINKQFIKKYFWAIGSGLLVAGFLALAPKHSGWEWAVIIMGMLCIAISCYFWAKEI